MGTTGISKIWSRIVALLLVLLAAQLFVSCSSKEAEDEHLEVSENNEFLNVDDVGNDVNLADAGAQPVAPKESVAVTAVEPSPAAPVVEEPKKPAPLKKDFGGSFRYKIVKNDWLLRISHKVYGNEMKWKKIHRANQWIKNPDLIYPGQILEIPIINEASRQFAESYQFAGSASQKMHHKKSQGKKHYSKKSKKKHMQEQQPIVQPQTPAAAPQVAAPAPVPPPAPPAPPPAPPAPPPAPPAPPPPAPPAPPPAPEPAPPPAPPAPPPAPPAPPAPEPVPPPAPPVPPPAPPVPPPAPPPAPPPGASLPEKSGGGNATVLPRKRKLPNRVLRQSTQVGVPSQLRQNSTLRQLTRPLQQRPLSDMSDGLRMADS